MEVQAEDLENFQGEENEEVNEGDSEIVTFKNDLKSRNNNASPSRYSSQDSTDSEGELSSSDDSEGEDLQNEGNSGRDVNQARMKSQAKDKFVNQMMEAKGASSTKEEFIDAAVAKFQEVFMKSGFIEMANKLQKQLEEVEKEKNQKDTDATKVKQTGNKHCSSDSNKIKDSNRISKMLSQASNSELTIYQNAVQNQINKRNNSSEEETGNTSGESSENRMINSSDEVEDDLNEMVNEMINNSMVEQFIVDVRDHQFPADHHWVRRENSGHTQG